MRDNGTINLLILGDEGVGKSSLVSTFVSRHFSELVPGILTRVRLPSDPSLSNCTTTIIDTQEGDSALKSALSFSRANRGSLSSNASSSYESIPSLGGVETNLADRIDSVGRISVDDQPDLSASKDAVSKNAMETVKESEIGAKRRGSSLRASTGKKQVATWLTPSSPFRNVDAIVLVYDLDRTETFDRLESHWLPLIERYFNGELPVVVAGNKLDLLNQSSLVHSSDNQHFTRSRQQIISLLQRFKFVRQCIKCSAKNLLHVDEVFRKTQQAVLYPIDPLFDLSAGKLTSGCVRAFTRIFRTFDVDKDGLLSDSELNAFQRKIWGVALVESDVSSWKNVVMQHNAYSPKADDGSTISEIQGDDVIRDGNFTVAGFLTIFDVFISQNRLEVPWKVLRDFGYDDDLSFEIPASLVPAGDEFAHVSADDWRLHPSEIDFLTSIFLQYDSDCDGMLSSNDIRSIFSVISTPLPPWSERRGGLFRGCFTHPRFDQGDTTPEAMVGVTLDSTLEAISLLPAQPSSPSVSASGITITSSSLPSVDVSKSMESSGLLLQSNLSYSSWINKWHMMCTISPSKCRAELFRLGHTFEQNPTRVLGDADFTKNLSKAKSASPSPDAATGSPSIVIRALVLGSKGCGKTSFIQNVCQIGRNGLNSVKDSSVHASVTLPETFSSVIKMCRSNQQSNNTKQGEATDVHLILTEIPADCVSSNSKRESLKDNMSFLLEKSSPSGKRIYDIAIFLFDACSIESFGFAKDVESCCMTEEMPRVFAGTMAESGETGPESEHAAMPAANEHCESMDLEPPFIIFLSGRKSNDTVAEYFVCCAEQRNQLGIALRVTPHGDRKRKEAARRRTALWVGGLVTAGITVVIGLSLTWDGAKKCKNGGGSWFKSILQKIIRSSSM